MRYALLALGLSLLVNWPGMSAAESLVATDWPQWRGPTRDGMTTGAHWPERLEPAAIERVWRLPLGPSYSGPVIVGDTIFTTETRNKEVEAVYAIDRATGSMRWRAEWAGAMSVPFFAASNGSWIRATPAFADGRLYIAGMRDVLVCLNATDGAEIWRADLMARYATPLPSFGMVCSPLIDGEVLYVQGGGSVLCLDRATGETRWRALADGGGMNGSAFSSPILATIADTRQLVVQTREKLCGLNPSTGAVLWEQKVPSFRGMNILTPVVVGDAIFTSSYQNKSWLFRITKDQEKFSVTEAWNNNAQGYMSTPVVVNGHAYLHLQSQRVTCINLATGQRTWTSDSFGKYWSMVAQGERILALDASGSLLLLKADPTAFTILGQVPISASESWAHVAVSGNDVVVREMDGLSLHRWTNGKLP
jgi:outer membrane protein assembly factor BamB